MTRRNALLLAAAAALAAPSPALASHPRGHDCVGHSFVGDGYDQASIQAFVVSPIERETAYCGIRRNGTIVLTMTMSGGVTLDRWEVSFTSTAADTLEVCVRASTSPTWSCKPLVRVFPVAN